MRGWGGGGWLRGRVGALRVCGVVDGDEKPCVWGVEEGEDDSWPESDIVIRAGRQAKNDILNMNKDGI